jgi:hypothetical protein
MRYLALCLYCRDENRYLKEWLAFHFALGIQHVIIYDNNSHIPLANTIKELGYGKHQVTVLTDASTHHGRQSEAYADCLVKFGNSFFWIGFIDTDEFIILKEGADLRVFLRDFEGYAGLGMFWFCFGSGGHLGSQELVLPSYTRRSKDSFDANRHIKTIVNTQFVQFIPCNPHHFHYKPGFSCVDENKTPVAWAMGDRTSERIQLNHYLLRSRQEWMEKVQRGQGDCVGSKPVDFFDEYDKDCNEVDDLEALKLAQKLMETNPTLRTLLYGPTSTMVGV